MQTRRPAAARFEFGKASGQVGPGPQESRQECFSKHTHVDPTCSAAVTSGPRVGGGLVCRPLLTSLSPCAPEPGGLNHSDSAQERGKHRDRTSNEPSDRRRRLCFPQAALEHLLIRQTFQGATVLRVGVSVELWCVRFLPSQSCLKRVEDSLDSDNDTLKVKSPRPESC